MIKLVAFDWNGTIFADTKAIFESNGKSLKVLNLKPISFNDFQKHYDVPIKKFFLALGAKEGDVNSKAGEVINAFQSAYEKRVAKVRTRANVRQLLEFLSKEKIGAIIFSNHIRESILKHLARLKIQNYFVEVLANSHLDLPLKGRNKNEKLKAFMEKKNLSPDEVLIIGDTIEEVEIGKELGCYTVAITHGNCSTSRLKKAKPDFLVNSLKGVTLIIKLKAS